MIGLSTARQSAALTAATSNAQTFRFGASFGNGYSSFGGGYSSFGGYDGCRDHGFSRGYGGWNDSFYGSRYGGGFYDRRPIIVEPRYQHFTPYRGLHEHGNIYVPHRGHYHRYRY